MLEIDKSTIFVRPRQRASDLIDAGLGRSLMGGVDWVVLMQPCGWVLPAAQSKGYSRVPAPLCLLILPFY